MTRRCARALRGQRALGRVPCGQWHRLTLLGALGRNGLVAAMTVARPTGTAVFRAFVEQVLLPALAARPGSIVVLDNLQPHKAACVRDAFQTAGVAVRYLPPYSPDFNPIEPCWSKLKTLLRGKAARSLEELDAVLPEVLDAITPHDARAWFKLCGYPSH